MNIKILPRQISSQQSARLGAYFATGIAASMAASSEADAAIVFFDVNPDQSIGTNQGLSFGNINLTSGTYTLGSLGGDAFRLVFSYSGTLLYNGVSYTSITWGTNGTSLVPKFSYGAVISAGTIPGWGNAYNYLATPTSGYWLGGGSGYAALRINAGGGDYNYGWVSINYDTTGPTATISGFAFEDQVNTAILAGDQGGPAPVPEPGTMAVGAGLFALAVGAHLRRRREKKDAASDALLNLAAGARGVEKFRADKAV